MSRTKKDRQKGHKMSAFKKVKRKERRGKEKAAMQKGQMENMPKFRKSDHYEFY